MKKIVVLGGLLVVFGLMVYTISQPDKSYIASVEKVRNERILFLKQSDASPFKTAGMPFEEPAYFPIDEAYRVNATLTRLTTKERRTIQNSDGTTATYAAFAIANFQIKGAPCQLLILKPWGFGQPDVYFTAFADETSALSTYGGGRYLDLDIQKSDKIVIDFNLAYSPYCAYVPNYTCPLPPKENILPVAIPAGEKVAKPQ